jgi:hypothetical protein
VRVDDLGDFGDWWDAKGNGRCGGG